MARMRKEDRCDCRKAEPDPESDETRCLWCGRPCKWVGARLVHLRGWRRVHDDPRKAK